MALPPGRSRAVRRAVVGGVLLFLSVPYFVIRQRRTAQRRRRSRTALGDASDGSDAGAPLILVMGLPHAGSIALHNFFQCNGIRSAHYCCGNSPKSTFSCGSYPTCGSCVLENMKAARPPFRGCGAYGAFAQFDAEAADPFEWFLPQHFALPLLHVDDPAAVWVLNRRASPQVWADAVLHWYSRSVRLMASFGMDYHSPEGTLPQQRQQQLPQALPLLGPDRDMTEAEVRDCVADAYDAARSATDHAARRTALAKAYERHLDTVRAFVREHPSHRLVEVDVDDPGAARVLVEAFAGHRANCWNFDPQEYDSEWKDFTLKV